jgi:2-polyprenyl-3-methyl-5-hydroxy-6-metoxy-1,4-benzoquinol methylase
VDDATIHHLNEINRRFYEATAAEFDATRQQPWAGWERLLPRLTPLTVLDAGCGNGRFGLFLAERLGKDRLRYVGLDSSAALLDRARASLAGIDAQFTQRDLIEQPPDAALGQFNLVVLFGVLHHVPGAANRLALLRALADRVAPRGLLVFTEWRFLENPRLVKRIVPWDAGLVVEPGDYLLDWRKGTQALRYCHAVDDAEHAALVAATGLTLVDEYRADAANLYVVLRKN